MTITQTITQSPRPITPARKRNRWWAAFCVALTAGLMALLHHLFWQFIPSQEKNDFLEEVQMLLDLQAEIKERTGDVATMDSIRDVVFGPNIVAGGIRKRAEQIVGDKAADETQQQYAGIIKRGLQRWKESSADTTRERILFIGTLVLLSFGLPLALWRFGEPGVERLSAKLGALRQRKIESERKKREVAMERARRKAAVKPKPAAEKTSS